MIVPDPKSLTAYELASLVEVLFEVDTPSTVAALLAVPLVESDLDPVPSYAAIPEADE